MCYSILTTVLLDTTAQQSTPLPGGTLVLTGRRLCGLVPRWIGRRVVGRLSGTSLKTIGHLSLRDFFVEVFREVGATALPGCIGQHFGNGVLDAFMGITGDKEDAAKSAGF